MSYAEPPVGGARWRAPKQEIDFSTIRESFELLFAEWKTYVLSGLVLALLVSPVFVGFSVWFFQNLSDFGKLEDILWIYAIEIAVMLLLNVIATTVYLGIAKFTWNKSRNIGADTNDLWVGFRDLPGSLSLGVLISLLQLVGVLFCGIGYYFASGLVMFAVPIKAIKGVRATEAIEESWRLLKSDWLMAAVYLFVASLASGLGAFACYVGFLLTFALTVICPTLLYSRYMGLEARPDASYPTSYPRGEG